MLHDDLNAPDRARLDLGYVPKPGAVPSTDRPEENTPVVADREVPLPNNTGIMMLHQWLDGDAAVGAVLATAGGNESVDLWTKINDEAELLRSRTTPLYVHKRIMEALPDDIYRISQPWYRRPVMLNPTAMIVGAAALLGFGALVAKFAAR
jgi:hypothetical protein